MPLKKMEETCTVCLSILNKYFITLRADAHNVSGLRTPYVGFPFHSLLDWEARWNCAKLEHHVQSGSGQRWFMHWMELLQIHACMLKNKPKECLNVCVSVTVCIFVCIWQKPQQSISLAFGSN